MLYISADNHLSRLVWKRRKELAGDSYRAFQAMVDAIIGDNVAESKTLLLAGDITDNEEIEAATFNALDTAAQKLSDANIPVFYIIGNHDLDEPNWPAQVGFVSLNGRTARIDDRRVHGLDYRPSEELLPMLQQLAPCDILVIHQSFEHLLAIQNAFDLRLDDIPAQVGNVVVGDIHKPDLTALRGTGWCLSPGSTIARKISETHVPGFWSLGASITARPVFHKLPHRQILRTEIKAPEELASLAQCLGGTPELLPLVELAYPLELAVVVEQFMAENQGRAAFFPRPGTTGKMLAEEAQRPVFDRLTLEGALPLLRLTDKDPETHDFLRTLLTHPNVGDYLDQRIGEAKALEGASSVG
jgi:DNA repair exonuclease SbcCD nuclease subunit